MDVWGIIAIAVFYALIYFVGVIAAKKAKRRRHIDGLTEEAMLAGRNIGTVVGIFTTTATWVGGPFITGTAADLYRGGMVACQASIGYSLSLLLGGFLFAKPMRDAGHVTMLDPFQSKYGGRIGGLMFIPALFGEVFCSAAILASLGATLAVILDWNMTASVILSAAIVVGYTFSGGLYAVAYTDIVQLLCIFIGLWVCAGVALFGSHQASGELQLWKDPERWIGEIGDFPQQCRWIDYMLLLVFGGIPWQDYFQRVLASRTSEGARKLSFVAGFVCLFLGIPPALIGAIARDTDWRLTDYDPWKNGTKSSVIPPDQATMIVPLVIRYLTPRVVSFIGIGVISAAVMSSADSAILAAASMFSHNIWKLTFRPRASERELIWVMKVGIIVVGALATALALTIRSVFGLWYLCSDLVYVILFPQLLCVLYFKQINTYGSMIGYMVGLVLRLVGGEPLLHFPALVHYPMYDEATGIQFFPFRTVAMVASLLCCILGSILADVFLRKKPDTVAENGEFCKQYGDSIVLQPLNVPADLQN